ncbi:type II toxin-antitoxin system RelB family antitoxin [Pseudomonas sp. H3_C08]
MIDPSLIDPLCPVVSDLDPEEQAASYDRWLIAKVQASLSDTRPSIPNDQVMAEMRALMEAKRKKYDAG